MTAKYLEKSHTNCAEVAAPIRLTLLAGLRGDGLRNTESRTTGSAGRLKHLETKIGDAEFTMKTSAFIYGGQAYSLFAPRKVSMSLVTVTLC